MEYQQIKALLDRYLQGETDLEEEDALRTYFSDAVVDPRLREYAPWFQWVSREQSQEMDPLKAEAMIDRLPALEARRISLRARPLKWAIRIAAALVLTVGVWGAYQYRQVDVQTAAVDWSKYEITDEKEALQITRGALFKASQTLNQGASAAAGQMDRMQEIGKFFK